MSRISASRLYSVFRLIPSAFAARGLLPSKWRSVAAMKCCCA
ncbi:hypothetical protein BDSB_19370 [Burkholderia dolosa PC543]|nr:hypothetical protein BDSB_19370 [Burkholderia dolosa PC543]